MPVSGRPEARRGSYGEGNLLCPKTLSRGRQLSEAQSLGVTRKPHLGQANSCAQIQPGRAPQLSPNRYPAHRVLLPSFTEPLAPPSQPRPPTPPGQEHSLTLHRAGCTLLVNSPRLSNVSQLMRTDLTEQDHPLGGSRVIVFTPKPGPI